METKKVTKWYWVWDYEKEELWLNAMAQEGWALQRVGFATYFFEKTEPGEYIVRLECRKKDEGYVSFVTDMGAEYIGRIAMWVYFRRKSELGEFELNSMAAEGWTLCQIGWCTYWFERTDPGAYEVRLECRKPDEAYISFVKDTGAGSTTWAVSCCPSASSTWASGL